MRLCTNNAEPRTIMVQRVIFPFRGAEIGGSHVATFALARALQRRFSVECVVLCPEGALIMDQARKLGMRVVPSGEAPTGKNNVVSDFSRIKSRRAILEKESLDGGCVVHCNDINTLRAWGLPARLCGMSVVYHHHALNRLAWPPHLVSLAYANAVVCVSDATLAALRPIRPDAVKQLNPFDIDPGFDRHAARASLLKEFGWRPDARIVGWIGNFWERKRPKFFLEVAAELARRDPKCRFVLFGRDGDYSMGTMKQLVVEYALDEVTALPGFRQPVEANVACLDLLLAPAPREPFGRTLVEAIILGTPIVATRGAGHSEIIGAWSGGQLANEDDTSAETASLCLQMLAAPGRYVLPPLRRREIAAGLGSEAYAERVLRIYESVSRRRRAAAVPDVA
jgi:glycosyltransferase involved in cell wall biosynthesis